ncbi:MULTISPECIES: motility protein A [unclassified Modestobacter]|uniref:motility protein A n=1 Tax=unclassified Modestobacter TaxID=2643866 RepID=UPI0022AB00A5|nr:MULTISPECIES: MotA/TolQ/ExbB proton channel family protein [unclassified Modestobacter]MCZ2810416.1 MotA/TolQ/ExbB proton channel family protein [Modestobacter sp. VKM Ac-2979]MCZ2841902.1 MotA/TolQ/ExbB proton channel family protein [Modestobacter sp. VKM Ac-2980]MCZ2847043.1 MotA/TolQ/ExbB proton channel family protein [Modestobacter sp. VKM Ac-2978]
MDPATLIGFVVSIIALVFFMILEGADPTSLIFLPAIILVVIATFGAALASQTMDDLKKMPNWFKMAVLPAKVPPATEQIQVLVSLAEKARKEGLLALEAQVKDIDDPFLKRGLQMSIDGTDPEDLRSILEGEISAKKTEDKVAAKFMNNMGGYAPTIGILGCIVGLMNVMGNLSNPELLGPMVSAAFIATLWGVMAANFWFLPMGAKILRVSALQAAQMELLVEGIAEIQAGTSPRTVRAKLTSLVPPSEQQREAA